MTSRIEDAIASVDGGVAKDLDQIVQEECECEMDELTDQELSDLEDALFTCEECGWTMPRDDERESGDGVCIECNT